MPEGRNRERTTQVRHSHLTEQSQFWGVGVGLGFDETNSFGEGMGTLWACAERMQVDAGCLEQRPDGDENGWHRTVLVDRNKKGRESRGTLAPEFATLNWPTSML